MMEKNKFRMVVLIDKSLHKALKIYLAENGKTLSEFLRDYIRKTIGEK